jgi:hypothetical protein
MEVSLIGTNVTDSLDGGYFFNQKKRLVHVAFYFEDSDRDDADGPGVEIQ